MIPLDSLYAPITMLELLQLLPKGARVLDLGCGTGSISYADFPELAFDALDEFPQPSGVAFPSQVCYQQGRAEQLPYEDHVFDLVISNFVLEHVGDFDAAIDEIARVLAPHGSFYMAVPNARSFEDALYRGLYVGGGHLQRHTFESVVGTVYARTALKLLSYAEYPAGFTFLQDREGLRALTARVIEACRESLGVDIRARSNYLFVFQQGQGIGRQQIIAGCGYCGTGPTVPISPGQDWTCAACGRVNRAYTAADAADAHLEADMQALWGRYPHLRPASAPEPPILPSPESAFVSAAPPEGAASEADLVRRLRLAWRMVRRGHV